MSQVRLEVLGELRAVVDGEVVDLGSERQRRVLVALLLAGPTGLTVDDLVERTWSDDDRPANPTPVLRTYVNRLRTAITPDDTTVIETRRRGYSLVAGLPTDAGEFERMVVEANDLEAPAERRARLDAALSQWRGRAFAGFEDLDWVQPEAERLDALRLDATEAALEVRIELGDHSGVIADVGPLLEAHPYREGLRRIHMLALYGAGRQAEALRSSAAFRDRMIDDLGLEPSPELRELEQRILEQDPALEQRFGAAAIWRHHRMTVVIGVAAVVVVAVVAAVVVTAVRRSSSDVVDEASRVARSREVLAAAVSVAERDPELAVLLAKEAFALDADAVAPFAVVDAIERALFDDRVIETRRSLDDGYGRIRYADISDDGTLLLLGDHDSFRVIDRTDDTTVRRVGAPDDGWFWFGEFSDDETAVVMHRHAAESSLTGFFYAGPRRLPEGRQGAVEIHDLASGEVVLLPLGPCESDFTAAIDFYRQEESLLAYVDKEDGPCDDFGGNDVVIVDVESGVERYRATAAAPSYAPAPTMTAERSVWHDAASASFVVVDLASGSEIRRIEAGEGWARLSPDGRLLAVVDDFDGSPDLYDVDSGALVDRLTGHDFGVTSVWWSPDSAHLLVAGGGALHGWTVDDGELRVGIVDREGELGAAYPNDRADLAVAVLADTDLFRIVDTAPQRSAPGTRVQTFDAGGPIEALTVVDGALIISTAPADATAEVLRLGDRAAERLVTGASAAAAPDAPVLALQQRDEQGEGPIAVVDTSGRTVVRFDDVCWSVSLEGKPPVCRDGDEGIPARATHVAWAPDGDAVAALLTWAGPDFRARTEVGVWDVEGGSFDRFGPVPVQASRGLAWAGPEMLALTSGYTVEIDGGVVRRDGPSTTSLASTPAAAVAGTTGGALVEVTTTGWTTIVETASETAIIDVATTGDLAAALGEDGVVTIADVTIGAVLRRLGVADGATTIAWLDDQRLAVGHRDGVVAVLEVGEIDLGVLLEEAATRPLTEAECEVHLGSSCADWRVIVTGS